MCKSLRINGLRDTHVRGGDNEEKLVDLTILTRTSTLIAKKEMETRNENRSERERQRGRGMRQWLVRDFLCLSLLRARAHALLSSLGHSAALHIKATTLAYFLVRKFHKWLKRCWCSYFLSLFYPCINSIKYQQLVYFDLDIMQYYLIHGFSTTMISLK